jgi:hypothetical protein
MHKCVLRSGTTLGVGLKAFQVSIVKRLLDQIRYDRIVPVHTHPHPTCL